MRIKYIYQLILSHISIIIIAFLILSLLFTHYVENLVYENKVSDLTRYGENILYDFEQIGEEYVLAQYQHVLSSQDVFFSIFDRSGRIVYSIAPNSPIASVTEEDWRKLTSGEKVITKHNIKWADQEVSLVAIPYINRGEMAGGILLISPISGTREMISELNSYLLYTVLIALSVSFLLSWLLSKVHVNRIEKIRKATSKIAQGNYDVDIPSTNFDEIGEMANDFNEMINKLRAQNEEIDSLEKRRRQFIADVSHEMRTPLTTIRGLIEGLKNDMIPEAEKEKGVQLISQETRRLIRLVNENLDYERIRSNQVKLNRENILLSEVLEIIKDHLYQQAENKGIELQLDVDEKSIVYADYDRLIQILINITKNSIQFTNEGTVWLRGKQLDDVTMIEIEDTGIGMDKQEIEFIWRRFYKADISRTSNQFGEFGLGLSIVKRLVELHNGEIFIESKQNKGTKFSIIIPIHG